MKRLLFCAVFILLSVFIFAQDMNLIESDYYKIYSEVSVGHAAETAEILDAYFNFYNMYFHFDETALSYKMKVKIFKDKDTFDDYLADIIPEEKNSFVFLQYNQPDKNELICYYSEDATYSKYLAHHGFMQFLKTFIPSPPLWMQKGFAIYFEDCYYSPEEKAVEYKENLDWLFTLKKYINNTVEGYENSIIPFPTLLTMNVENANASIDVFYAQSWGLVHFLLNSTDNSYNRILWDSIKSLSPDKDRKNNEVAIIKDAFEWVGKNAFSSDFIKYIDRIKTFPDLVQDGMDYYAEGDLSMAERTFINALSMRDDHPVPYYYLGLIYYAEHDYMMAEYYYQTAVQMGGEEGITYYALGVNAYADNRFEESVDSLVKSYRADPDFYGEKSVALMVQMDKEQPGFVTTYLETLGISEAEIEQALSNF